MDYKTIRVTREDGYAVVVLNRPHEMNALSREMKTELVDFFSVLEPDDAVRAVILTGGDYFFSAWWMWTTAALPARRASSC